MGKGKTVPEHLAATEAQPLTNLQKVNEVLKDKYAIVLEIGRKNDNQSPHVKTWARLTESLMSLSEGERFNSNFNKQKSKAAGGKEYEMLMSGPDKATVVEMLNFTKDTVKKAIGRPDKYGVKEFTAYEKLVLNSLHDMTAKFLQTLDTDPEKFHSWKVSWGAALNAQIATLGMPVVKN